MSKKNDKSSIFIGRWQPFHDGHKKLIESVLKKGKPVLIAIRDTLIDQKNPYSTFERWSMIQRALKDYGELVKIIIIPDIDEVCYGRDVGYNIREIELDEATHNISGTKIREQVLKESPIIWLTGQSGAGKSTIAKALKKEIGGVILDGDEMRESISISLGFSEQDREEHNLRVARLAKVLSRENIVIVSVIAPFQRSRAKVDKIIKPIWVFVDREIPTNPNRPYQKPKEYSIKLDSDRESTAQQIEKILNYLQKKKFLAYIK